MTYYEIFNKEQNLNLGVYRGDDSTDAISNMLARDSYGPTDYVEDENLQASLVKAIHGYPDNVLRELESLLGPEGNRELAHKLYDLGTEDRSYNPPIWYIRDFDAALDRAVGT